MDGWRERVGIVMKMRKYDTGRSATSIDSMIHDDVVNLIKEPRRSHE